MEFTIVQGRRYFLLFRVSGLNWEKRLLRGKPNPKRYANTFYCSSKNRAAVPKAEVLKRMLSGRPKMKHWAEKMKYGNLFITGGKGWKESTQKNKLPMPFCKHPFLTSR